MRSTSSPPVNAPSGDDSDSDTRGGHPARVPFIGDTWRMHHGICKKEDRRRRELSVVEVGRPRRPALHPAREQQKNGEWQSVQNDVTDGFCAVFDLAGVEHGRMRFPKGGAPETLMYPMGEDIGEAPEGENWQEGLRLRVKMPGEDFWRTLMSSAIGLWRSLDRLHDQYVEFAQKHPGKVPLVELIDVMEIKARTTSYAPTFGIIGWVDPDKVLQPPTEDQDEDFDFGSGSGQSAKAKVAARGDMDDEIPW